MAVGDLLSIVGNERTPLAIRRRMAPRDAAAKALAAYLKAAHWLIPGTTDVSFQLKNCLEEWPDEGDELDQPSAAIAVVTESYEGNFTPVMLEGTHNQYAPNTVLWKVDEVVMTMQVDFYLTNKPERQAIHAGLKEAFAPCEGRYGVLLEGPAEYWTQPVRCTLVSERGLERLDDSDRVMSRDRGLLVRFAVEIDDLQLRRAALLDPRVSLTSENSTPDLIYPRPLPE